MPASESWQEADLLTPCMTQRAPSSEQHLTRSSLPLNIPRSSPHPVLPERRQRLCPGAQGLHRHSPKPPSVLPHFPSESPQGRPLPSSVLMLPQGQDSQAASTWQNPMPTSASWSPPSLQPLAASHRTGLLLSGSWCIHFSAPEFGFRAGFES